MLFSAKRYLYDTSNLSTLQVRLEVTQLSVFRVYWSGYSKHFDH